MEQPFNYTFDVPFLSGRLLEREDVMAFSVWVSIQNIFKICICSVCWRVVFSLMTHRAMFILNAKCLYNWISQLFTVLTGVFFERLKRIPDLNKMVLNSHLLKYPRVIDTKSTNIFKSRPPQKITCPFPVFIFSMSPCRAEREWLALSKQKLSMHFIAVNGSFLCLGSAFRLMQLAGLCLCRFYFWWSVVKSRFSRGKKVHQRD